MRFAKNIKLKNPGATSSLAKRTHIVRWICIRYRWKENKLERIRREQRFLTK